MTDRQRVTKRSKVRVLTGGELERAIVRLAVTDPGLVAVMYDGKPVPGVLPAAMLKGLVPAAPLKRGRKSLVDPADRDAVWDRARARLRRERQRQTVDSMAFALAAELGIDYMSPETVKRLRKQYALPFGD